MDHRIEAGFRRRLSALLPVGEAAGMQEVERLLAEARERAGREAIPLAQALLASYERVRDRVRSGSPRAPLTPRFLCDRSLVGLARWLHAAGYEAEPPLGVEDHRLPDEARTRGLVLLTSDTEVLERRIVQDGSLRVVWFPSSLTTLEKLGFVLRELGLALREPRCMACGGRLVARAKDAVSGRIPPRTARWKDEYFVCEGCDRLFWQGTHWQRIAPALARAAA